MHDNGPIVANVLGPLSIFNVAFATPCDQLGWILTPWLLAFASILQLRAKGKRHYVAITMHAMNPWMVYHCIVAARLGAEGGGPNIFQWAASTIGSIMA